jgi:hypothetical protein
LRQTPIANLNVDILLFTKQIIVFKTNNPIIMNPQKILLFSTFLLINNIYSQSVLLSIPGSVTPFGPTGYISFLNQTSPQFEELPAHSFVNTNNPGQPGNPHSEEDLNFASPSIAEKYLGQHPLFAQSVVHDMNGEIVFFIIDNNIYNRYGVAFEDNENASVSFLLSGAVETQANIFSGHVDGNSINRARYANTGVMLGAEILVFPISGKCNTYGLAYTFYEIDATSDAVEFFFRTIEILDERHANMSSVKSLAKTYNLEDCSLCNNIPNRSIGISKMRQDGTYILFVNLQNYVYAFNIDQNGSLSYNDNWFSSFEVFMSNQEIFPSANHEMEIIEITDSNGNPIEYRLAVPINARKDPNTGFAGVYVYSVDYQTLELMKDGNQNPLWTRYNMPQILSLPNIEEIKGIEFSKDGQFLFITYYGQSHIHYIDLQNKTIYQLTNGTDYQYTSLEMGYDCSIYFLGINEALSDYKVSRLTDPENPSITNWEQDIFSNSINRIFLSYQYDNYLKGPSHTPFIPWAPKLCFMAQITDQSFLDVQINCWNSCCDPYTIYNWPEGNMFAQNPVWTWEPGNNPFNNTTDKVTLKGTLELPDYKKLVIKNMEIEFMDAAEIIVKWGSELIIDGTLLTGQNPCGSHWQGITVLGKSNEAQTSTNQGKVLFLNQSVIADAIIGISTGKARSAGGIIQAENATFRNCETAVQMHPFKNNGSHYATSIDQSYFRNCTFVTDDDFLLKGVTSPTHMDLNGIYQLRVQGCTFRNDLTPIAGYLYSSLNGTGIMALDASVVVTPLCTTQTVPCGGQIRNQFINLHHAIHITQPLTTQGYSSMIKEADFTGNFRAVYANSPQLLQVKQCTLVNNYRGVYLLNSQGAMVEGNEVEIAQVYNPGTYGFPYGLYLDGGNAFSVEGNKFINTHTVNAAYGIVVNNTGAKNNEIYLNIFKGLKVGIQPQFRNKGKINNEELGLCLFCNEFNNPDTWDIWVAGKTTSVRKKNIGINVAQQISNPLDPINKHYPAGNLFSPGHLLLPQNPSADNDFSNFDAEPLTYAYDPQATTGRMEPVIYSNIALFPRQSGATQCIPKTGTIQSLSQAYASMGSAQAAFNSSKLILDIYRNNGIPDLGEQVETTQPWEVYQEFNNLMSISPYVDADVVLAMVQNDVFTSLMVKLVCVANPQSARNDAVLEALYNRIPPMPEQYMEEILDESGSYSPLDELIGNTAADLHMVRTVGDEIIRMYLADTTNSWSADSLTAFLARRPGLEDRYVYALHCMRNGQTDTAQTILAEISSGFTLSEREQIEHESYVDVFDMLADIGANEIQPGDLTPEQTETLMLMLESEGTVEKSLAIALLKWNNPELEYNEPILEPIYYQARKAKPQKAIYTGKVQFSLYPNPARDFVTLSYLVPENQMNSLSIQVKDATGRSVLSKQLPPNSSEYILDTKILTKGVYTVVLLQNNSPGQTAKLVIVK